MELKYFRFGVKRELNKNVGLWVVFKILIDINYVGYFFLEYPCDEMQHVYFWVEVET